MRRFLQRRLLTTTVLAGGALALVMLAYVEQIGERLLNSLNLVDSVIHLQADTLRFHLDLEEVLGAAPTADLGETMAEIDRAIDRARALAEEEPTSGLEIGARARELREKLAELKTLGQARLDDPERSWIGTATERAFDTLYRDAFEKGAELERSIGRLVGENTSTIRSLFDVLYVVLTVSTVFAATGLRRVERRRNTAEEALRAANAQLTSQADELAAHRNDLLRLVDERTEDLVSVNRSLNFEIAERRKAEETLRASESHIRRLSSQLLLAQEVERGRISMEIHDGLGQALNVIKLKIRAIEKSLEGAPLEAKEDCERLLEYLNIVIEDARRVSQALSPTMLEDLGLTAALGWLVSDFRKAAGVTTTYELAEIDELFSSSDRITVYRVAQESLANIGKHARARNVAVFVARLADRVEFTVEDDGIGFDPEAAVQGDGSRKGLGLETMRERVAIMGGDFRLWSRKGHGTRISFAIPVNNGGN